MIAVAEAEFRLDIPGETGQTPRAVNTTFEKAGLVDKSWRPEAPPHELAHIWRWFGELHAGRHVGARDEPVNDSKSGGFLAFRSVPFPLPITYQDIDAWARITGRTIGPFELSILRMLDNTYFAALRDPSAGPLVPDPDDVGKRLTMGLRARALADKQGGIGSGR